MVPSQDIDVSVPDPSTSKACLHSRISPLVLGEVVVSSVSFQKQDGVRSMLLELSATTMRNDVDPGRNVFREGMLQSKACEYARVWKF